MISSLFYVKFILPKEEDIKKLTYFVVLLAMSNTLMYLLGKANFTVFESLLPAQENTVSKARSSIFSPEMCL
jgi:hypothetical protein